MFILSLFTFEIGEILLQLFVPPVVLVVLLYEFLTHHFGEFGNGLFLIHLHAFVLFQLLLDLGKVELGLILSHVQDRFVKQQHLQIVRRNVEIVP